jgi:uncharacterized protein
VSHIKPAPQSTERRFVELTGVSVRAADGKRTLSGHAAVFDKLSVKMMGFREYIRKGAFTESIAQDDIRALWNHDSNLVLGRNKSGTLRLKEDAKGLAVEIDLPDTQAGRDAQVSIDRGDVTQMSFAFRTKTGGDNWFEEDGEDRRELLAAQLFEVSPVTFPAYPDTDVSLKGLRSLGLDPETLSQALDRAAAGQELRSDDAAAIEHAYTLLTRFRKTPAVSTPGAKLALLRRQLDLAQAQ